MTEGDTNTVMITLLQNLQIHLTLHFQQSLYRHFQIRQRRNTRLIFAYKILLCFGIILEYV